MASSQIISLDGKVALVTGGSSGIGSATAQLFSELGAKVAIVGRNKDNLEKTAQSCPNETLIIVKDLACKEGLLATLKSVVDETVSRFGRLDVLVNSAGILATANVADTSEQVYDDVFLINTKVPFFLTQFATPHLEATKGNVVNVSSVNGIRHFPGVTAYNMSKSAMDQLTATSALDLAPKGIRVNSVNPGVTITEVHKRAGMSADDYEKFLERSKSTHPLGRVGEAREVANTIAFLASSASSFTTGVLVPIDGGRHAASPR